MIQATKYNSSNGKVFTLSTFFCLYIAQSVPMSFFSTALQVLMRQDGFSLSQIALLQVIKIPWILKFLWSPLVDRKCQTVSNFKHFIVLSELVYATLIMIVGFLHLETDFRLILLLVFLSLIASATQDIATDALAVLSFHKKDKSMVNSMQSMGSFGGSLLGSGILLFILQHYGWKTVMPCLSLFVLVAIVPLILNKKITIRTKKVGQQAKLTDFIWFFARRSIWKQIGFLMLFYSSIIGLLSMLRPYMVDLGYDMKSIGFLSGIVGTGAAFGVSFVAGLLVRKIGHYYARIGFSVFILMTTLYFLLLSQTTPNMALLTLGIVLLWSSYAMATIVVYTTAMNCVRPGREGTDFTIQTVLTHVSGLLAALLSGNVADIFGYSGLFLMETGLAALSLLYICVFFKKNEEQNQLIKEN